jgi:hypothetical protein
MKMFVTALATLIAMPAAAQTSSAPPPDYTQDAAWLCRPGRSDACAANQDVTVIRADGKRKIDKLRADAQIPFDCFYVYPTVSNDATPNSDLVAGPEEIAVAGAQAARFRQHCRVYAPLYRQVTLTALRSAMAGAPLQADRELAYADLARDKGARGVVLIGHSQGSTILKRLIAEEIEGKPVQRQLISAMLIGTNVAVPAGQDVGGDFKRLPLCRKDGQHGCIVTYVTYRADSPPPANARFGRVPTAGQVAACTNPTALAGGRAVTDAILGAKGAGSGAAPMGPWTRDGVPVTTGFVRVPGLISAECVSQGGADYLAVTVNADPADPRTDTIVGDVAVGPVILKDWGLHLIDMGIAMGDLVALADRQATEWRGATWRKKR